MTRSRSYTAQHLIQLPRLNAGEALVLVTQVLAAAEAEAKGMKGQELPASIERSRKRLTLAHAALEEVVVPQGEGDPQARRQADRVVDTAWSATHGWLGGFCKLPEAKNPELDRCKALFALLFPDALDFTRLPFRLEWQQSKSRIDAIDRDGYERLFKQLGGAAFLANLREAQDAYGVVLGITVPSAHIANPEVGDRREAAAAALRDYVTRVAAYGDPEVAGSEALAEKLLLPLSTWESTHRASAAAETPAPANGGLTPVTTTTSGAPQGAAPPAGNLGGVKVTEQGPAAVLTPAGKGVIP